MNELQEALDRIFNNCEEINNHNPAEEQTGYKMIEDIKLLGKGINDLQQRIDKAIKIYEECKLLMPHEFDWGEQVENIINNLKGGTND